MDCDPYAEECFVWECDPESTEEGEACTGDAENDIWYFKVAKRNASRIPLCDPNTDENCQPMLCEEGEKDCEEIFCAEDQLEAQYASGCVDPVKFTEENPVEEEGACEEGDEACEEANDAEEVTDAESENESVDGETGDGSNPEKITPENEEETPSAQ